jgi:hypothetical protein
METNASRVPLTLASYLLARAQPFESDPPAVDGTCGRCAHRGAMYQAAMAASAARFASGSSIAGCRAESSGH